MSDPSAVLALEPDDLDGHTVDELDDYLQRGRDPADPSIDASPSCQIALSALQRLHDVAGAYLDDVSSPAGTDQDWISAVLTAIPLDARAGRRFPMPAPAEGVTATVTEGAVRGLVRSVGDEVPGLLVGGVRIAPEEQEADDGRAVSVVRLAVEVALVHGTELIPAVAALRRELLRLLPDHVPFQIEIVDVVVVGLIEPVRPVAGEGR